MVLVALLSARAGLRDAPAAEPSPALLDFGGQSLIEYQARLALGAGAEKLLIYTDAGRVDTLSALQHVADHVGDDSGCPVILVQDMTELARAIAPEDHVLLLGEGLIVPSEALDALMQGDGEAVLTVPSVSSTANFERLDATTMWGGALSASGGRLLSTLDMLGDWDLVLTLLRRAVQDGVDRVMLSADLVTQGRLAFLRDQASADLSLDALSHHAPEDPVAKGALAALLAPVSRTLVREFMHRQIEPSRIGLISLLVAIAALALVVGGWTLPALLLSLPAFGLGMVSERYAQITLRANGARWQYRLVQGGALVLLAIVGVRVAAGDPLGLVGVAFPLLFIGLFTFGEERSEAPALWQAQSLPGIGAALVVVLLGVITGLATWAFALLGVAMAAMIALRLFRLGEAKL
jgi:hypothetical protein